MGFHEPGARYAGGDKIIVASLITSRSGEVEGEDMLKRRPEEAAPFVPIEQSALSPKCGFASTEEGNILTQAAQ